MAVKGTLSRDPHEALGIPRDASPKMIKRAYRKLARANHPDHHPENVARFREISEAYEALTGKGEDIAGRQRQSGNVRAYRDGEPITSPNESFQGGGIFGGPAAPEWAGFRVTRR